MESTSAILIFRKLIRVTIHSVAATPAGDVCDGAAAR